jgi:hypothetical protein
MDFFSISLISLFLFLPRYGLGQISKKRFYLTEIILPPFASLASFAFALHKPKAKDAQRPCLLLVATSVATHGWATSGHSPCLCFWLQQQAIQGQQQKAKKKCAPFASLAYALGDFWAFALPLLLATGHKAQKAKGKEKVRPFCLCVFCLC